MPQSKSKMVTRLLKKIGSETNVKIIRESGGTRNPLTGKTTGGTTEMIDTISFISRIPDRLIDGERIRIGDKQVLFDNSVTVNMTDIIQIPEGNYIPVLIDGYNHAGEQQFWKVICRG